MKSVFVMMCLMLSAVLLAPTLLASSLQDYRLDADQSYLEGNFKKAHKLYTKLAKFGDHYSQDRVAQMYAAGEGKNANLTEAYAWSVLAAEVGDAELIDHSSELLQRTDDKEQAQKRAAKLKKKYGEQALRTKAIRHAVRNNYKKSGACTGTHLACARG